MLAAGTGCGRGPPKRFDDLRASKCELIRGNKSLAPSVCVSDDGQKLGPNGIVWFAPWRQVAGGGGSAAGSRGQVAPPEGAWAQRLAPVRMSDGPCRAPLARVIGGRRPSGSPPLASVAPPESVRRDAPNWAPNCTKSSKK